MQDKPKAAHYSTERQQILEQFERRFSSSALRKRRRNHTLHRVLWLGWIQTLTGAKRSIDLLSAASLLLLLSPLMAILYLAGSVRGGAICRTKRLGRWGATFDELSFRAGPLPWLPAMLNVWKGDMSLIGPRAVSPGEVSATERAAWRRFNLRPGLICLWWVRKRANIAYATEFEYDSQYLDTQSFWGDVALGLRAIPAAFYGEGVDMAPDRVRLLGIPVDNLTMDEAVEEIIHRAQGASATQLCFVNADCVNIASRDEEYKRLLLNSELVLADGIGVKLAGRILNTNIRQNVNGTDLFPFLCDAIQREGLGLYLLGGRHGVAEDVASWIRARCPALQIRGYRDGFFSASESESVAREIRNSGAEILLVALGAPRQEKWIRTHLAATGVRVAMGVGGLFDFYSGRIPRAPAWVREIGMEWFYRFLQEPRRMWRRYFVGNAVFLSRVLVHRFVSGENE